MQPLAGFDPIPETLLELFVPRKRHKQTGEVMKFFEKGFDGATARELWAAFRHYHASRRWDGPSHFPAFP